jgi:serine phosphatase RsbU (regulator of sigma subunit)
MIYTKFKLSIILCLLKYAMSKVLLTKHLFLLTLLIVLSSSAVSQKTFSLRGQLLVDKKVVIGAIVTVYDGKDAVSQTVTNQLGKFWVELQLQKSYVVQFKKKGTPTQKVIISTENENLNGNGAKSKVVVFTLSSAKSSKEGPSPDDAVTSFLLNEKGMLEQKKEQVAVKPIEISEQDEEEIVEIDEKIEELETEIETIITQSPDSIRPSEWGQYDILQQKKDSVLLLAEEKAQIIVNSAQKQSTKISDEAIKIAAKTESIKKELANNEAAIKSTLKKLAIKEKGFLEREDIQNYRSTIEKYEKKGTLSRKDSLEMQLSVLGLNEEMIKTARLELEVAKLNARTKEDSIAIQEREVQIYQAEQEIKEAKNQIEIQKIEIRYKDTMLMATIVALLVFAVLMFLIYKSLKDKKKANVLLEKQNTEIAKKNKKIIDSIRYAQTIQHAILPVKSIIDKHFDWFVIFQPKDIVSGDFYWFNHFEETGKSVFAVIDCTGHGVPGAFMSLIGNRLLVDTVKGKGITEPVKILEEIDEQIRVALMQDETSNNDGMDICICTLEYINDKECKVDFAGAKRPLFYSNGNTGERMKHIKGTVRGIGGKKRIREKPKKPFVEHSIVLSRGDMVYLTTDGFFDLQSPNRKKFGRVNFMNLLENSYNKSLTEQKSALMDALHLHKGSEFQIDDITILGVKL